MKNKRILFLVCCLALVSCKKFMEIDAPVNSIVTEQVFADSLNANSAIQGIYTLLNQDIPGFCNGRITSYCGEYGDEIIPFLTFNDQNDFYYYNNLSSRQMAKPQMWDEPYLIIHQANLIIENLKVSKTISVKTQNEMLGEVRFLRSLIYFYLINLYGNIPYVISTAWAETSKTPSSEVATIYQSLISDLLVAQSALRSEYSLSAGQKIRANKWAATALLARCYLYQGNWDKAEIEASKIIQQTSMFKLSNNLATVFEKNSSEAILQWNLNSTVFPYNATPEGIMLNPEGNMPQFYLSDHLLNDFEPTDQRKSAWTKVTNYAGMDYTYPYKYKNGYAELGENKPATECYTVLRLAEQFLIRAEARAQTNNLNGAIDDINMTRARAGLLPLGYNLNKDQVLSAIMSERRIEFFAEWGHRWFDLKRTGRADEVMAIVSPLKNGGIAWQHFKKLWPIPDGELKANPFLTQNPGY